VTPDSDRETKLDDQLHDEFLEAAIRSRVRRSDRNEGCPEEAIYWAFVDDETSIPDRLLQHITICLHGHLRTAMISAGESHSGWEQCPKT